ncbi:MAG: CHRD domain-containing protein [Planctomycetota bacterium]
MRSLTPARVALSCLVLPLAARTAAQGSATLLARLDGASEVPPVATAASGRTFLTLDPATGALSYSLETAGLVGTAAHIHRGAAGVVGPVAVPLAGGPTRWSGAAAVSPADQDDLLNALCYVNVHSAAHPAGEIRGQILAVQDGLAHSPLGNAHVSLDGQGNLVVSNLGSSGQDGVRVHLGESNGFGFTIADGFGPPGSYREWTRRGEVDGVPDQPTFSERFEIVQGPIGPRLRVVHDSSAMGATQLDITFLRADGSVVFSGLIGNGVAYEFDLPPGPFMPLEVQWDNTCVARHCFPIIIDVPQLGISLPDVDAVRFYAVNPTKTVTLCSAVDSRAANVAQMRLDDETVVTFGRAHAALGQAVIEPESKGGRLKISNLGSSGCDGFSIDLGESESVDAVLEPVDPAGIAGLGASMRLRVEGTVSGVSGTSLGELTITKQSPASFDVVADLSAIGSTTQRVEVLSQGALVTRLSGLTVPMISSSSWPYKLGKLGGRTECFVSCHDAGTSFLVNGAAFVGDELRILAESSSGSIESKSRLELYAAGLSELVLIDEVVTSAFLVTGTGCSASGNPPAISAQGSAALGSGSFACSVDNGPPGAPAVMFLGTSTTSWLGLPLPLDLSVAGYPGCTLYQNLAASVLAVTSPIGTATVPLPIPASRNLIGVSLPFQWAVAEPGGLTFTPLGTTRIVR